MKNEKKTEVKNEVTTEVESTNHALNAVLALEGMRPEFITCADCIAALATINPADVPALLSIIHSTKGGHLVLWRNEPSKTGSDHARVCTLYAESQKAEKVSRAKKEKVARAFRSPSACAKVKPEISAKLFARIQASIVKDFSLDELRRLYGKDPVVIGENFSFGNDVYFTNGAGKLQKEVAK